ncbi:MAG: hypothetical protein AAFN77_17410 [Planctomycetota bacterium]
MKILRSVSLGLVVGAAVSFLVAYGCYERSVNNAEAIARMLGDGFEIEHIPIPIESKVGIFVGVLLLVAGINCYINYRRQLVNELKPE